MLHYRAGFVVLSCTITYICSVLGMKEMVIEEMGDMDCRKISDKQVKILIRKALEQLPVSYAPYSHFHVAAALLCQDGSVYTGCNIENASYPAGICAERTAFFKAVSEGKKKFSCIAIAGGKEGRTESYCPPCGICRQVMREFCNPQKFFVILAKTEEDYKIYLLEELLPESFGPEFL